MRHRVVGVFLIMLFSAASPTLAESINKVVLNPENDEAREAAAMFESLKKDRASMSERRAEKRRAEVSNVVKGCANLFPMKLAIGKLPRSSLESLANRIGVNPSSISAESVRLHRGTCILKLYTSRGVCSGRVWFTKTAPYTPRHFNPTCQFEGGK